MGRKTDAANTSQKLNEANAEAARILSLDLARCSAAMNACLDGADKTDDWDDSEALIERAMQLAGAMAKLGAVIGRLNGEKRQTISVERNAECTEIAPESAPNKIAQDG